PRCARSPGRRSISPPPPGQSSLPRKQSAARDWRSSRGVAQIRLFPPADGPTARADFPHSYCMVQGTGHQALAVRTDGEAGHTVGMAFKGPILVACAEVPHLDRPIVAAGEQTSAVGAEGDAVYVAGVP